MVHRRRAVGMAYSRSGESRMRKTSRVEAALLAALAVLTVLLGGPAPAAFANDLQGDPELSALTYDHAGNKAVFSQAETDRGPKPEGRGCESVGSMPGTTTTNVYDAPANSAQQAQRNGTNQRGADLSPSGTQVLNAVKPALISPYAIAAKGVGMGAVRAAGQAGERAAGIVKNTERIPSLSNTAAYRIPDELGNGVLGEVKNVSRLSYSNQLRDFASYAQQEGLQFNLYVRGGANPTRLSGPLQQAVDSGQINLIPRL